MLEEQVSSPVIREVLCHLAGRASASGTNITSHGDVKGISANDVMQMRGRVRASLNDGVKTLNSQR